MCALDKCLLNELPMWNLVSRRPSQPSSAPCPTTLSKTSPESRVLALLPSSAHALRLGHALSVFPALSTQGHSADTDSPSIPSAAAVACRGAGARPPRHSGSPAPPSGASPTRRPCPPVGRPAFAGPWSPARCPLPCVCSPGLGPQCHPRIRRVSRGRGVASTLRFET